jgi:hypothetical protein
LIQTPRGNGGCIRNPRNVDTGAGVQLRMKNVRYEGSVLSSLEELKKIEADRIAEENAAVARAVEARRVAHEAALERARAEAEAKVRAEHEAKLAAEAARVAAERDARLRLEAADAAERARTAVELESARIAAEAAIAREEASKKRPRWMIALTLGSLAAAGVAVALAVGALRTTDEANSQTEAHNATSKSAAEQKLDKTPLTAFQGTLDEVGARIGATMEALKQSLAESEKKAKADKERRDRQAAADAEQARRDREYQQWLKERRDGAKIDQKCLNNAVCK